MSKKKRKPPVRTTSLTKAWFESQGYDIAFVERFVRGAGMFERRFDAFGFADHIAFNTEKPGAILVQSAAWDDMKPHLLKVLCNKSARAWVSQPHRRIFVVGWKKVRVGHARWVEEVKKSHFDRLGNHETIAFSTTLIDPRDVPWTGADKLFKDGGTQ